MAQEWGKKGVNAVNAVNAVNVVEISREEARKHYKAFLSNGGYTAAFPRPQALPMVRGEEQWLCSHTATDSIPLEGRAGYGEDEQHYGRERYAK
jgi:hypothetical protein